MELNAYVLFSFVYILRITTTGMTNSFEKCWNTRVDTGNSLQECIEVSLRLEETQTSVKAHQLSPSDNVG